MGDPKIFEVLNWWDERFGRNFQVPAGDFCAEFHECFLANTAGANIPMDLLLGFFAPPVATTINKDNFVVFCSYFGLNYLQTGEFLDQVLRGTWWHPGATRESAEDILNENRASHQSLVVRWSSRVDKKQSPFRPLTLGWVNMEKKKIEHRLLYIREQIDMEMELVTCKPPQFGKSLVGVCRDLNKVVPRPVSPKFLLPSWDGGGRREEEERKLREEEERRKREEEERRRREEEERRRREEEERKRREEEERKKKEKEVSGAHVIDYYDIQFGEVVGKGGFGEVSKGEWQYNAVAIKKLLAKPGEEAMGEFENESALMAKMQSKHLVRLYGITRTPELCLVMEYCSGGDLAHRLRSKTQPPLTWKEKLTIADQIMRGLGFLHNHQILHRDLKCLNVLLDDHGDAKLTDFGLSRMKKESAALTKHQSVGTLPWMAPELFAGQNARYTAPCDIYSLGMTYWEMASGQVPFQNAASGALISTWVQQGERPDFPPGTPEFWIDLVQVCWGTNPRNRITLRDMYVKLSDLRKRGDQLFQQGSGLGSGSGSDSTLSDSYPRSGDNAYPYSNDYMGESGGSYGGSKYPSDYQSGASSGGYQSGGASGNYPPSNQSGGYQSGGASSGGYQSGGASSGGYQSGGASGNYPPSNQSGGYQSGGASSGGYQSGGASSGGYQSGGASGNYPPSNQSGGYQSGGASSGAYKSGGASSGGYQSGGASSGAYKSGGASGNYPPSNQSGGYQSGGASSGAYKSGGASGNYPPSNQSGKGGGRYGGGSTGGAKNQQKSGRKPTSGRKRYGSDDEDLVCDLLLEEGYGS